MSDSPQDHDSSRRRSINDEIDDAIIAAQGPPRTGPTFEEDLALAQQGGIRRTAGVLREYVATRGTTPWLIKGVVKPGWIVKIAAPPKCGKGELAIHMIAALEHGTPSVFDAPDWRPPETHTTLIVTEEPDNLLAEKLEHHDVRASSVIFDWELDENSHGDWKRAVKIICAEAVAGGHSIIFLDNISALTKCADEAGVELAGYLKTLKMEARRHELTVIVDHHHRKSGGSTDNLSRGSTSIAGLFDNNIDLKDPHPDDPANRVREVYSKGRGDGTRWATNIVFLDDNTGYRRTKAGEAIELTAEQAALRDQVADLGHATLTDLGATTSDERRNLAKRLKTLTTKRVLAKDGDRWTVANVDTKPAI